MLSTSHGGMSRLLSEMFLYNNDMTSIAENTQDNLWDAPMARGTLEAVVEIPGSKSLSNRYLVLAALSAKPCTLHGLLRSRDTDLMMNGLARLGVGFESASQNATTVRVIPPTSGNFTGNTHIDCGLAGTVMRFLPGLALFADGPVTFDGDKQAYARPMMPLLDGLEQLGARIEYMGEPGFLPFRLFPPSSLHSVLTPEVRVDSSASSQFISGLLLISSRLPLGLHLFHTGKSLPSLPHIRMTIDDVARVGGQIVMPQDCEWAVEHHEIQCPDNIDIEPDLSNAAPFLAAALIVGGSVEVPYWPQTTTQPGGLLPNILQDMGAHVEYVTRQRLGAGYSALRVSSDGSIRGLGEFDLSAAGELAPSIAALAVLADSDTVLHGIAHLRGHETNRLEALVSEIRRVGAGAEELADGIAIHPVPHEALRGAVMQTYADHRMATFAAMLGLAISGTRIVNIETTKKTIPDFSGLWNGMITQTGR